MNKTEGVSLTIPGLRKCLAVIDSCRTVDQMIVAEKYTKLWIEKIKPNIEVEMQLLSFMDSSYERCKQ